MSEPIAPTLSDPLENLLSYQLRRAALGTIAALADSYAAIGLTQLEAIVIRFVKANPGCTQSEIGRAIGVKRTNMAPIVNGLIGKSVIERTPADGRSQELYLTAAGDELHRKIARAALEHEKYFFGDVPEPTRKVLMQAFRSVRIKAEQRG